MEEKTAADTSDFVFHIKATDSLKDCIQLSE
jgi:hypothetical protein